MKNNDHVPIHLRTATLADIPTLIELEKSVSGSKLYSPMLEGDEWEEELLKSKVFLIGMEAKVIGNVSYEEKEADHIYLSGLVIDPRFQGKGVGRQALVNLLEKLKDAKRIDLVTHPDNQVALQLYQSLGFVVESRKENYYGDGEPRLVLALKKNDPHPQER